MNNLTITYRPEIDGLRAIAVISVVLFHAGYSIFSGGYVGVDIFFVISGYLITSIINKELQEGKFNLIRFYERRCRRIIPALIFVIILTTIAATHTLTLIDLKKYFYSVLATVLFSSNLFFFLQSGYFSPNSELTYLMHTWSLGVEEQFYFIFPFALIFTHSKLKDYRFLLVFFAIILSLFLSEWTLGSRLIQIQ